jgi:hypothetical protein
MVVGRNIVVPTFAVEFIELNTKTRGRENPCTVKKIVRKDTMTNLKN